MGKVSLASAAALIALTGSSEAGLGDRYTTYRDLHEKTQYGSLFFNEGAIRERDSRQRKRFVQVTEDGQLELPKQQGYCFVFNHYDSPGGNDVPRTYSAIIRKSFSDGRETEEPFSRGFIPTANLVSAKLPDLCISGTNNVSRVSVEFTSDDGTHFDWKISFAPE